MTNIAEICDPPTFIVWPADIVYAKDELRPGQMLRTMLTLEYGRFEVPTWEGARRLIEVDNALDPPE